MVRTCGRCSFANTNATGTAEEPCPNCGVIYSKWAAKPNAAVASTPTARAIPVIHKPKSNFTVRKLLEKFFWALTIVGGLIGGLFVCLVEMSAKGAPQEAAGAAMGLAMAAIPYCIARALQQYPRE